MRIQVTRRGGLAGIPLRGEVDTSELPGDEGTLAEDALHLLPDSAAGAPQHPDGFQYEIAFSPPNGASRSTLVDESEVPDVLRPVIQAALNRGTLG
ncbi:MAG: hypothetical protein M3069_05035 [Chloroflexota bacterium]|nr:hypothetical protein [Chloroflexota bacterium]